MFVTASNFDIPPFDIPNLDAVDNTFPDYIEAREKEGLLKLLGRQLYDAFMDGLEALPDEWSGATTYAIDDQAVSGNNVYKSLQNTNTNHAVTDGAWWELVDENNKWLKLKNGANYSFAGRTWKWAGMTTLLTPYIYSQWVKDNVQSLTGVGVVSSKSENADVISPSRKICKGYNRYLEIFGISVYYCLSSSDTLYGFLIANQAYYPLWYFNLYELEPMNAFNL